MPDEVRVTLLAEGYKYPQKVISVQMLKGGVAKTTSVLNMGLRAAMYGARVLFIDLDQQANLSFALGVEDESLPVWVDIVEKKKSIEECVRFIEPHVDLIPSSLNNSVMDRVLMNSNRNWAQAVKVPLEKIRHRYDLILIDTAPALSATNTAVTIASDEVILPVNPDKFAMLGLEKNLLELADIKVDFDLQFNRKILFTKFDGRENTSHELLQKCIDSFADELMTGYIRTSSEVKNSVRSGKSLFAGKSPVKADYDLVTREVLGFVWGCMPEIKKYDGKKKKDSHQGKRRPHHEASHAAEETYTPTGEHVMADEINTEAANEGIAESRATAEGMATDETVFEHSESTHHEDAPQKVHLDFYGSNIIREKAPKVMELADTVADEWTKDGQFEGLPVGSPIAQMAAAKALRKAKDVEKKLEEKGVFMMAKIGLDYVKSKIEEKKKR